MMASSLALTSFSGRASSDPSTQSRSLCPTARGAHTPGEERSRMLVQETRRAGARLLGASERAERDNASLGAFFAERALRESRVLRVDGGERAVGMAVAKLAECVA